MDKFVEPSPKIAWIVNELQEHYMATIENWHSCDIYFKRSAWKNEHWCVCVFSPLFMCSHDQHALVSKLQADAQIKYVASALGKTPLIKLGDKW